MLILPTGGKGIGVEANGSNFPFVAPSPDIQGLLADLWLAHEYHDVALPLRVSRMSGFQEAFDGLPSAAQITVVDAADATVFDSAFANYYWKDWGHRLRIHEWVLPNAICRAVQHRAIPEPVPPWPEDITPISGVLDERTSMLLAERLLILSEAGSGVAVTGEVTLVNGWNIEIVPAPYREPLRNTTMLTFSANPGGGPGRYPGCQDAITGILTINGTPPDARGNFTFAADGCYYARQPVTVVSGKATPVPAMLDLGNDCGPCCDCDDFVNVQKAILNIEAGLRTTAALAEATRDEYAAAIERWNTAKECREQQSVVPTATTTNRRLADISIVVCNSTPGCLIDMHIEITPTTQPAAAWTVVPGTTYITKPGSTALTPYLLDSGGGIMLGHFDAISPGSYGQIRTRLQWSQQLPQGALLTVPATATLLSDPDNPLFPQTGTTTVAMT